MSMRKRNPRNEKPISLHPLSLEKALGKAMNVIPPEKYKDLVGHLATIPINGRNPSPASDVANDLLKAVLRERWHPLSDTQRKRKILYSTKRIYEGYMRRLKRAATLELAQSHEEAAGEAIDDELNYLEQTENQPQDDSATDL